VVNGQYAKEEIDIVELAILAKEINESVAEKKNNKIDIKPDNSKINVMVNSADMLRVFNNLLENAIKFTDNGIIEVAIMQKNAKTQILITDNGKGMNEYTIKNIWFFQTNSSDGTDDSFGSGLGLTIVKDIVKAHNGTIEVESTIGKGTTFKIELP
jgi:signal transduction histidine kinase